MSINYCSDCGTKAIEIGAAFCHNCGKSFGGAKAKVAVPAPQPPRETSAQRRRIVQEHEQFDDDTTDEDDDNSPDDAHIPDNLTELEVDVEVHSNRQSLSSLAYSPRSTESFQRPPEKVPKNKKQFDKEFMAQFAKDAGAIRPKKK